jgi:hypothetical protein
MAFLITEQKEDYIFNIGPQKFDDSLFTYSICLKFIGTHGAVSWSKQTGGIKFHKITIEDETEPEKVAPGTTANDMGEIVVRQGKGGTQTTISDMPHDLNQELMIEYIDLQSTTKSVTLRLSSKYGLDKIDIFLLLKMNETDGVPLYIQEMQNDAELPKIEFNLLKNNKFNFCRMELENYFEQGAYQFIPKGRETVDIITVTDFTKAERMGRDSASLDYTGLEENSKYTNFQKLANNVIEDANLKELINDTDWLIFNAWSSNTASLKFHLDDVKDGLLNIKLNREHIIPEHLEIQGKSGVITRAKYPNLRLYFYLGEADIDDKLLNLEKRKSELDLKMGAYDEATLKLEREASEASTELKSLISQLNSIIDGSENRILNDELKAKFENNLEKLYVLNSLNKRYETLMSQKDEILESDKKYEVVTRAIQLIQKRITFYRERIKKLGIATMVVHITLAVIIILGGVKQVISK